MIQIGKTYNYSLNRTGNRKKTPVECKVLVCGRANKEDVGIKKTYVLVKMLESKPFYVDESSLT